MSASAELQRAIHEALASEPELTAILGSGRIHDMAAANVPYPYITLGRTSMYDWSTGTELGTEHLVTLHIWSKAKGKREAHEIMDLVANRLHDAELDLEGHHLVNLRLEFSEIVYDENVSVHHGLLRFRAATEPIAG